MKIFSKIFFILLSLSSLSGFAGADFKKCIVDVMDNHPIILASKNQLSANISEIDSAKWAFYPTPSVGYEKVDNKPITSINNKTSFIRLQQPLWTGGRLTSQLDKAEAQAEAAQQFVEEQKITTTFRWLQLWADLRSATLKLQAYQESEKKHAQYVNQVSNRTEQGYSAKSDLELSVSRLMSIRSDLSQAQMLVIQARSKLEQMLQRSLARSSEHGMGDSWPADYGEITSWAVKPEEQLINDSLSQYPSLRKLRATIQAAQAEVTLTKSRNVPEVYLRAEASQGDVTKSNNAVYVGFSSNFGPGLSNISAVAAAQARVEAYQSELESKRIELIDQIQADQQMFLTQSQRVRQLEEVYQSNSRYLSSSERQFLAGRKTWQEIMNIAREEAQILVQIADAKSQTWLSYQRLQIFDSGLDFYLSGNIDSGNRREIDGKNTK